MLEARCCSSQRAVRLRGFLGAPIGPKTNATRLAGGSTRPRTAPAIRECRARRSRSLSVAGVPVSVDRCALITPTFPQRWATIDEDSPSKECGDPGGSRCSGYGILGGGSRWGRRRRNQCRSQGLVAQKRLPPPRFVAGSIVEATPTKISLIYLCSLCCSVTSTK
jgi:hypothetical protein